MHSLFAAIVLDLIIHMGAAHGVYFVSNWLPGKNRVVHVKIASFLAELLNCVSIYCCMEIKVTSNVQYIIS